MSELVGVSGRVGIETVNEKDVRPIKVGDRFETLDKRVAGRVIEIIEALPIRDETRAEQSEWMRQQETRFRVRTEAHPRNPDAVGNVSVISEATLCTNFQRVSR